MTTNANNFELNKGDQFIIAIDTSGSMQTPDCDGATRFVCVMETVRVFIAEATKWDPDGVSIYPFASKLHAYPDVKSSTDIDKIMSELKPIGATMTHLAIEAAYKEHATKGSEQTFLMIFTDGEPSEPELVKNVIVNITKQIKDDKEFRISILTVGERTAQLEAWLDALDNDLDGAVHDIVAVNRLETVDFMTAVENAITG